jgi:hypothetical protein
MEDLKRSASFLALEAAAVCATQLIQRNDKKFDLDSAEGQESCKKFLENLEKIFEALGVKPANRKFRQKFSNAYKVLYKEG